MAILLAIGAAFSNALTTILQRLGVEAAPPDASMRLKLVVYALRNPVWIAGLVAMIAGFLFQATALSYGQLSTVQPILVTELIFLVAILGFWFHNPVGLREWGGALATCLGLGVFLYVASPGGGNTLPASTSWMAVGAACLVALGACVGLTRFGSRARRAAFFGAASAIAFAFTAALMKTTTDLVSQHGWTRLLLHWQPYAIVLCGLVGMFLAQNAFHAGPITASQSSLVTVDPFASILIGIALFGDRLRTGPAAMLVESFALLLMFVGLYVLCHSPLIAAATEEESLSAKSRSVQAVTPQE